ncbi:MAG: hypothetical protein K5744_02335, partial [Eubacterium sp.]|nr:hypothetical protein [Eubacterium sp.]
MIIHNKERGEDLNEQNQNYGPGVPGQNPYPGQNPNPGQNPYLGQNSYPGQNPYQAQNPYPYGGNPNMPGNLGMMQNGAPVMPNPNMPGNPGMNPPGGSIPVYVSQGPDARVEPYYAGTEEEVLGKLLKRELEKIGY